MDTKSTKTEIQYSKSPLRNYTHIIHNNLSKVNRNWALFGSEIKVFVPVTPPLPVVFSDRDQERPSSSRFLVKTYDFACLLQKRHGDPSLCRFDVIGV